MRIGLDVRYLSHGLVGGVHTYVRQLLPPLLSLLSEHEVILYADTKRPFELQALPAHVQLRSLPWHSPLSSVANDLLMWRTLRRDRVDLAHFTGNYGFGPPGAPTVVTLQDEINLLPLRELFRSHAKNPRTMAMMTYLHLCTRASTARAHLLLTVSEYSRRQICRHSSIDPQRVQVIHHGCPADISRVTDLQTLAEVRQRLELHRPFILAEAFKNPAVLIRAWRRLPQALRDSHMIVFFSRSPEVLPVVYEAMAAGYARMFVRPARSDLSALYSMAAAFVFPSWIEGFGIPLVEAMACGAPIITSDRGSIPEVVGDAARIVDAEDDQRLAEQLGELLRDHGAGAELRALGLARARRFTWAGAAQQVLDSYMQITAAAGSPRAAGHATGA